MTGRNRSLFEKNNSTVIPKLLLIIAGLVLISLSSAWVAQSEWGILLLVILWGGIILLPIWPKTRPVTFLPEDATDLETTKQVPKIIQFGFYLFLLSFAIGWRELWITSTLKIHPSEAIIWGLFFLLLVNKKPLSGSISPYLKVFYILGLIGLVTALTKGISWGIVLSELKLLLVIIPIFYVTQTVLYNAAQWRKALFVMALGAAYTALFGLLEYYFPSVVTSFAGSFFTEQHVSIRSQGFVRAAFSFWGSSVASIYLSLMLVPIFSGALVEKKLFHKSFLLISAILCGWGVYIAGGRGPWTATIVALFLYLLLSEKRNKLLLITIPSIYIIGTWFLPVVAFNNFYSALDPVTYYDTSALVRQARAGRAIELIKQSPILGHGWGGSGWVHSDLLQIGANLGLFALMVFILWYATLLWRLYNLPKNNLYSTANALLSTREYSKGLLAGILAGLFHLTTQALIVLPFLIIPLWFLVAAAECFLKFPQDSSTKPDE